jgi:hypothetical protein
VRSTSSGVSSDRQPGLWFIRVLAVVTAGASLALLLSGSRLLHEESSSGLPDRVRFDGRDYNRGRTVPRPADSVESGRASGGETVYKPVREVGLSVVIWVCDQGETRAYGLVGGP